MPDLSTKAASLDLDGLLGPEARRSPDMDAVWSWLVEQDAGLPDWLTLPPAAARAQHNERNMRWNAELPTMAAVETLTLAGSPKVKAQMLVPQGAKPGCIVFLHGGGWAFGNLDTYARFMRLLAQDAGLRVIAVDYRLAPENPFPAGYDDCLAAWRAIVANGHDADFDGPLAIAGDSAGAQLALAVTLNEIREGRRKPDAGLLFYGAYAADFDTPSYRRFADGYGLTRAAVVRFWEWLAPPGIARDDVRLSPLLASEADVARLPPLFVNAAGLDPLLSDSIAMAGRLDAAGVPHRLVVHEGVHHGFMQMSLRLPEARAAIREAAAFLAERVGS